ncbi:MAG: RidA family protein [Ruminococcus sp.]|nr:RidA family protein [Ruminococcus sp.]
MKIIETKNAPAAIGPYSQAVVLGDLIYTSGQIPIDPATGRIEAYTIKGQTEQIIKNLSAILTEAGSNLDRVIKTTCYLNDIRDFGVFNEVYGKYFTSKPARGCVEVSNLPKGALAEIEVIAEVEKR